MVFPVLGVHKNKIFLHTLIVSLTLEIIGSKTGYIFGGKYHYNQENTPGYVIFGIPVLIPIAWFANIHVNKLLLLMGYSISIQEGY